jgi:exonuclease SbcC
VLDGAYASLTAVRKQQKDDSDALTAEEEAFPELEAAAGKQAAQLKSAEQQSVRIKDELKAVSPILRQVRALDQKLSDRKRAVAEEAALCRKDAARIDADRQARREQREICSKSHEALAAIDGYLDEHAADEWLIGGLAGIEEQISGLLSRQQEILQQEADQAKAVMALKEAARSLADCRARCDKRKRELEEAANRLQQGRGVLSRLLGDRLLREYRAEKERLLREMVFLSKIAELEEYRARLEDGEPCPLCGATGHPYAEGNTPVPDDTETKIDTLTQLIEKAEAQEAAIERFEAAENLARTNLTEAEREVSAAVGEERSVADLLAGMKAGLAKHRAEFDEHKQVISKRLLPLGVAEIPEAEISALLESLRSRLQAWQARVEERAETGKRIAGLDGEVKRLDAVIETQSTALDEKRKRLETLKKELATVGDERSSLYGDKNPDDEERRLNMAVSAAEDAERQARERYAELQQKSNTARARIGSLKMRIDRRAAELASAEAGFSAALAPAGFADEGQFLQARLSAAHRDGLTTRARALDERQTALKARQNDREQRLASEIARALSDESLELLESRLEAYQASLQTLRDLIAGFRHRLSENGAAKARIEARQAVIERQRTACRRWDNLHALIGSGDGRKYRNFAQGLTFEMMIGHANRQLRKMTDRYLLIRDELQPLALNVIDNYQAGEVRSTRNLSGGESFIVSLSLALGLSHMASRNVRVDSLFLDEGFGTLDEEALEIALDTLAGLQQEGKLIGVISHVQALKERIATRIRVVPKSGGRSEIQGVGCSSIGG